MKRFVLGLAALTAVALAAPVARADDPGGSLMGAFIASDRGDLGAGAMIDLGMPLDVVRLGGSFGVGSLVSTRDETNRVVMPLAVYVGLVLPLSTDVSLIARVRGGIWGGATQEVKLTLGGFVGGGVALGIAVGRGVTIDLCFDLWGTLGGPNLGLGSPTDAVLFAPGLGLTWGGPDPSTNPGDDA